MRSTKSRSFNYAQRERALALIAAIVTSKNLDFYRHSLVINSDLDRTCMPRCKLLPSIKDLGFDYCRFLRRYLRQ